MTLTDDRPLEGGVAVTSLRPSPAIPRQIVRFGAGGAQSVQEPVISEIRFTIFVGDRELVTLMCSPWKLRELVVGFLYIEGLIDGLADIDLLRICLEDRLAEVTPRDPDFSIPTRKILTSGCTGGQTFGQYLDQIDRFRVGQGPSSSFEQVSGLMRQLYAAAELYKRSGGVHTSVLADAGEILIVAEDIGRHNTLDKIRGESLLRGISTTDRMILTSGRISSEMLLKSAIMGVPIVGSRTSPTELAVTLADRLNITLIGYIRSGSMNVYTHPWRLAEVN